ncbi:centromere/kinetochore protein zw10 homolog [Sitophilus oryzae]|uniref:Centromere/kinetochore protein zw10 homolog n=1 Tax=Sitophilus oryzae TaxID=7048 RepID=A0A6J2YVN7_SITOR|nr:centromere/kinetochore protein zw10 homolog [Sitophilus oryzae]
MSILAQVLESAKAVDADYINKKVPELKQTLDSFRNEVVTAVENVYTKYSKKSRSNDALLQKVIQAQQNLSVLREKADYVSKDLEKTNTELYKNVEELESIEFSLKVIENLQVILNLIQEFNSEFDSKNFTKCVKVLTKLKSILYEIPPDESLDVINVLRQTYKEKEQWFLNGLKNVFTDNIEVQENQDQTVVLKIKKQNDTISSAMKALYEFTEHIEHLNYVIKQLWNAVLVPVVNSQITLTESKDSSFVWLTLKVQDAEKKSHYKKVFKNLKTVFQFLFKNFNYEVGDNLTSLSYIGNDIRHNLSELIIKNCLRDTIPSNVEELEKYKIVIEDTHQLEDVLLDTKIFDKDTSSILEYASNIDVLFINKKCEEYLQKATEIMKKDLHDMVEVGVPYDPNSPLGHHLQDFPQCSISKNVQELLKLCENILREALNAAPDCSGRLFVTVSNIIIKYPIFVSDYHKHYLATLPQQIALFYNNCNFISHTLREWNTVYCSKLVNLLITCDFNSEATQLPIIAVEIFSNYIDGQIKLIDEIMSGAQLDGSTIEKVDPKTEKCVRQCLRQQELLKTVWHKVLSYNIYNKHIGSIVDSLCKNIINSIIKFEDIPATVAEELVDIIKLVLTRAPKLFTNPREITLFVPLWYKLNEVSFVLNASLVEISDRWADGKGPLAMQFEAAELKKLIKSLFQNTDIRAAILTRITDIKIKS